MTDPRPLVVTLALDPRDQERFDAVRRAHFPPGRLQVGAHVTLFHALPGAGAPEVRELVAAAAWRPPFAVAVTGVRSLGRGVAYALASPELAALHADLLRSLVAALGDEVTAQDRQRLSAHVTVQNKVPAERARALHAQLSAAFVPGDVTATGLATWRYAGGPWEHAGTEPFSTSG